ncbi:hypothetical protein KBD34_03040 [Patescibacteria group bacterium]|nr:hypothetical protein [Patescibacteria group bacterium]
MEVVSASFLSELETAQRSHTRLFELLRSAGWTEERQAPLPSEEGTPGFVLHDYAQAFLRSFHEIKVVKPTDIGGSQIVYAGFKVGLGPALQRMDPPQASVYIDRIAGTSFVYPVMNFEDCVAFLLEDGRALAVDEIFRGCVWTKTIFDLMHWAVFKERLPGFEMRELTMQERPLDYRW